MKLLDYVKARCRIEGRGECWMWRLSVNVYGYPWINTRRFGRGIVMRLLTNCPPDKRMQNQCGNRSCCNPSHWLIVDPGKIVSDQYKDGRRNHTLISAQKGHLKRKDCKGGFERARQARDMVNAGASLDEVAEHFGIDRLTARRWANGKAWREPSPWAI